MSATVVTTACPPEEEDARLPRIEALAAMLGQAPASSALFTMDEARKADRVQHNLTLRVHAGKLSWGRQTKMSDAAHDFLAGALLQALALQAEACPSCLQPAKRVNRPGKLYRCAGCMHSWRE